MMASKNEMVDWLKHHTLQDMKSLAQEMADEGRDVRDLVEVIRELEDISTAEGIKLKQ